MNFVLAALDSTLVGAWEKAFSGFENLRIHNGSIFDVAADALVSPANSYGFMDGGIDAIYSDAFGWDLQLRLRRAIAERHHGELLVGSAEIVPTGKSDHPYLVAAPTMRVPMVLDRNTVNPFLATRAVLLLLKHGMFPFEPMTGLKIRDHVRTVAFPGMGTGVGQVSSALCARQMRAAFEVIHSSGVRMPTSWAEASEMHQLLYTDRPKRLQ